ncbi:hypothetical protein [Umezawaea beigongshangensis]|uniref:hypothetical protein n=1 Tax=Umezawaea beigongshangensis TaxID=2780383 RepID=UPI0018F24E0A|nr:hypothetical protein [Umezawaea beigongshangensis]
MHGWIHRADIGFVRQGVLAVWSQEAAWSQILQAAAEHCDMIGEAKDEVFQAVLGEAASARLIDEFAALPAFRRAARHTEQLTVAGQIPGTRLADQAQQPSALVGGEAEHAVRRPPLGEVVEDGRERGAQRVGEEFGGGTGARQGAGHHQRWPHAWTGPGLDRWCITGRWNCTTGQRAGRPPTLCAIRALVLRSAEEDPRRGTDASGVNRRVWCPTSRVKTQCRVVKDLRSPARKSATMSWRRRGRGRSCG